MAYRFSYTHTYVTLDVEQSTFDDIKARLAAAGALSEYLDEKNGEPLLMLGALALKVDKD